MKINRLFFLLTIIGLSFVSQKAFPNVASGPWKPDYVTEVIKAPPPPNLEARVKAFANRNSPESLKALADQLFGMINLADERLPAEINGRYRQGDYQGALDAYRDFVVKRWLLPPGGYPLGFNMNSGAAPLIPRAPGYRWFLTYLATPQDLMSNVVVFAVKDKQGKLASLRMDRGAPGQFNWSWCPEGYVNAGWNALPSDAKVMIPGIIGWVDFFDTLLDEYFKTRNKAYLLKWAEILDDRSMNWRADLTQANLKAYLGWGGLGFFNQCFVPTLAYLTRTVPEFGKDLPSPTLARILIDAWTMHLPLTIRAARQDGANRRVGMRGSELYYLARSFPEFKAGDYCLREFRRIAEAWPYYTMLPDGSMPEELTMGYYLVWPLHVTDFINQMRITKPVPEWLTPEWMLEINDKLNIKCRQCFHEFMNNGAWFEGSGFGNHGPTWLTEGEFPRFLRHFPVEALADAENARIRSTVFGDGTLGPPLMTSEYFPYGGRMLLRSGWSRSEDVQLYMHNNPLPELGDNLGIEFYAYGKPVLLSMWKTPLRPDGCGYLHVYGTLQAYWASYHEEFVKWREDFFGHIRPQSNRWHNSVSFDVGEGTLTGPYVNLSLPGVDSPQWQNAISKHFGMITDVRHRRQILFARGQHLFIIADRVFSTNSHNYQISWPFTPPEDKIMVDQNVIRTKMTNAPNLSIFHFYNSASQSDQRNVLKVDKEGCNFGGKGNQIVVSLLSPRRTNEAETIQARQIVSKEDGVCGFETTARDGTRVFFQAAPEPARLRFEKLEVVAETLLLTISPSGEKCGIVLGCKQMSLGFWKQKLKRSDFEFKLDDWKLSSTIPIFQPLKMPVISPATNSFIDQVEVSMAHPEPGVKIHYTLDGRDPTASSPVYSKPIVLRYTTTVKARAFRPGVTRVPTTLADTHVSSVMRAVYTKSFYRDSMVVKETTPGLTVSYYEGDWTLSALFLDQLKPVKTGTVSELFDFGLKQTKGNYGFVYQGYLEIPRDGVYDFHAPLETVYPLSDAGYDLRVFVGRKNRSTPCPLEEWYPTTRIHNNGIWSVPLRRGLHELRVIFIDQRPGQAHWKYPYEFKEAGMVWRGEKPALMISGPGLEKQLIPARMLFH